MVIKTIFHYGMDNLNEETKNPVETTSFGSTNIKRPKFKLMLDIILGVSILAIIGYYFFSAPVRTKDVIIHVSKNESLSDLSIQLKNKEVVSSGTILKIFVYILNTDKNIKNGDYLFEKDKSLFSVAWQISRGIHGVSPVRVTLTEGMTNEDMAKVLSEKISTFRRDLFLSDSRSVQGYLFPDTYFFFPQSTTDEILDEMTSNFKNRINPFDKEIKSSGKNLSDIITMASILEKEAKGKEDSYIISGILWKRIKMGMPLQVDAAPVTYKEDGLPAKPISNPGLATIKGAINPEDSPYLFYLHDDNGQVHFAVNFSEHRSNISKYLK